MCLHDFRSVGDGAELYLGDEMNSLNATPFHATSSALRISPLGLHLSQWYAVQTCANHEKRVLEQLSWREVEAYLPLYGSVRRWKDRRVLLDLPLFPGYVFVRLLIEDRLRVMQTPGVARLVGFGGRPVALPDHDIEVLRQGLVHEMHAEPHAYLKVGHRVRVKQGSLQGLQGILLRKKNSARFVISIDLIMRSVAVEIDVSQLEPIV